MADELVVEPQTVLVRGRFAAGAWRAAQQAHPGGRLKHIRGKGAAVGVEFDAQIARVGDPGNLVAFVEHYNLRNQSNEYGAFSHFVFSPGCNIRIVAPQVSNPAATIAYSGPAIPVTFLTAAVTRLT